jgi:hypothetical protein
VTAGFASPVVMDDAATEVQATDRFRRTARGAVAGKLAIIIQGLVWLRGYRCVKPLVIDLAAHVLRIDWQGSHGMVGLIADCDREPASQSLFPERVSHDCSIRKKPVRSRWQLAPSAEPEQFAHRFGIRRGHTRYVGRERDWLLSPPTPMCSRRYIQCSYGKPNSKAGFWPSFR